MNTEVIHLDKIEKKLNGENNVIGTIIINLNQLRLIIKKKGHYIKAKFIAL